MGLGLADGFRVWGMETAYGKDVGDAEDDDYDA